MLKICEKSHESFARFARVLLFMGGGKEIFETSCLHASHHMFSVSKYTSSQFQILPEPTIPQLTPFLKHV